jgi:hypothetical protein
MRGNKKLTPLYNQHMRMPLHEQQHMPTNSHGTELSQHEHAFIFQKQMPPA